MTSVMALKIVKGKSCRYSASSSSTTQLHYAAQNGNNSMVTFLLNTGCNVDEQDKYGKTALMLAVEGSHENTVAALLKFLPNIYAKDKFDKSVLQRVFELSLTRKAIIDMFLNVIKKDCVDDSQRLAMKLMSVGCPLYWAVLVRDAQVTRFMLDNGCAVGATDSYKPKTALHVAVETRDFANAKLLVEYGADVNALDSSGRIPLACLSVYDDSDEELEVLQMLLDRSTNILNESDGYGHTQLRSILVHGQLKAVQILFKYQFDWCTEDKFLQTPLHYLTHNPVLHDSPDIVYYFRDKKLTDFKGNILSLAASRGLTKLVEILLSKGADPNVRSSKGNTPLLEVCSIKRYQENAEQIVALLLQYDADPQVINIYRSTVFDEILKSHNFPLAKYIIGYLALMEFLGTRLTTRIEMHIRWNKHFQREFELCKSQIGQLQQTIISDSMSLFELLNTSAKTIAVYARDQDFFHDFASYNHSTLNPYFSDILRRKLKDVKLRLDTADFICEIMGFHYDAYPAIVDLIVDYVSS